MSARPISRWFGVAATAVVLAGLLAACGSGSAAPSGSATVAVSSTSAAGTAGRSAAPGASAGNNTPADGDGGAKPAPTSTADVDRQDLTPAPKQTAVLTGVRAGAHGGYDRVVFAFDGPIGGYVVRYVDQLTSDPSGKPVKIAGDAALQVAIQGATLNTSFQTSAGETPRTYDGPDRVTPKLESVKEIVQAGDYEASLSYGLGIDGGKKPFSVTLLPDPTRLVVDVAH